MRKIFASGETDGIAKLSDNKKIEIYSFFPNDRANCVCQPLVLEWKNKLAILSSDKGKETIQKEGYLVCPRSKVGLNRYQIACKKCKETLGYCWASDASLKDFCDFHYVSWSDGKEWHGCYTPHISPITQQLCFECSCGEDTRDFRANMTLSYKITSDKEKVNSVGREFNKADSKFEVRQVANDMLPFKKEVING